MDLVGWSCAGVCAFVCALVPACVLSWVEILERHVSLRPNRSRRCECEEAARSLRWRDLKSMLAAATASFAAYVHGMVPSDQCIARRARVCIATEATPLAVGDDWMTHIEAPKLLVRPEAQGKGGVQSTEPIAESEVLARIPRALVLYSDEIQCEGALEKAGWAAELTAAALKAQNAEGNTPIQSWIRGWQGGGWGSDVDDLGLSGIRYGRDDVIGSLIATGSDNDEQVYSIFKFPCHPVVYRASLGLASLTRSSPSAALAALVARGAAYRSMRDDFLPLVTSPTERAKGSARDKKSWDVADAFNRVLSRATTLALDGSAAPSAVVVPLYDRLAHCKESVGENVKLEFDPENGSDEVLLVATREIAAGEALTRDYSSAPRLPGDTSEGELRLLLQFGVFPSAWEHDAGWDAIDKSLDGPAENAGGRREVKW